MSVIETTPSREGLPLLVIPNCVPVMVKAFRALLPEFDGLCRVRLFTDTMLDEDILARRMKGADAVIVVGFHVSDDLLKTMSQTVRCIAFGGTGVDNYVNLEKAHEYGMRICNIVHYGDAAVAEHAIALLMEITRRVGEMNADMHEGEWQPLNGTELYGKTMGIVGFGGIGQWVARIAHGFGMHVKVWSHHPHVEEMQQIQAASAESIHDLFESSDVVSLHLAYNRHTKGIVTADDLAALRKGSIIINTARAELIEKGALAHRLEKGDIFAGLDVFDTEPMPEVDPLRVVPNTILTPHAAWCTDQAVHNAVRQCVDSIRDFYAGKATNVVV
ncbi:NAD(P)-dependent oxidoreductase [Bifidobacterium aquikefiri]|uniref:NAD(P)-dependent oxidoreductase n=1 Tax=Bifidobacterium aquikefiri TaxID=1653207 RepID=UPI0039EA3462